MIKLHPVYEDHKTYPILIPMGGGYTIVEMLGKVVNDYNRVRVCPCCAQELRK